MMLAGLLQSPAGGCRTRRRAADAAATAAPDLSRRNAPPDDHMPALASTLAVSLVSVARAQVLRRLLLQATSWRWSSLRGWCGVPAPPATTSRVVGVSSSFLPLFSSSSTFSSSGKGAAHGWPAADPWALAACQAAANDHHLRLPALAPAVSLDRPVPALARPATGPQPSSTPAGFPLWRRPPQRPPLCRRPSRPPPPCSAVAKRRAP